MVANSPGLIAGSNVLHRLLVPRHPPIALSSLSHNKNYKDARVHYTVLKIRAGTPAPNHHLPRGNTIKGNNTPIRYPPPVVWWKPAPATHLHQPHDPQRSVSRCSSDPEKPVHLSEEIRPDSSGPNSAPRPFTPHHSRSTLPLRREFAVLVRSAGIPA